MRKEVNMNKNLKYIVKIGILSAVAAVLMLFELPLWFAPPFYKLDFSEIPILIGSFALGPLAGVIMELLKNLLNQRNFSKELNLQLLLKEEN